MKILIINGPNLQLLGIREVGIYGQETLYDIEELLKKTVPKKEDEEKIELEFFQSNYEGAIVDKIGNALKNKVSGMIINPAAYTYTSIAIRDALKAVNIPAIEVHISNIYAREEFRKYSIIAPVCIGQISGFGIIGYRLALSFLIDKLYKG